MNVKVNKAEDKNEVKLEITVEASVFEAGIKKVFNKNSKYFAIPGFRKGKAPYNIVEKFYGAEMFYEDAFNEIVPEIFNKAIEENKVEAVTRPEIDIIQMEKGKDLIFTATVAEKPEVKLGKYKGITLEKVDTKVTAEDVNNDLKAKQEANARQITVTDRAVKKDDTANIDYDGSVDGVHFEGGKAEGFDLVIGSNTFIPGFEDQVIGMKVNEEKDIKVTFPTEYHAKDLAGKEAVFTVKVNEIKAKELPELDDEFAKDISEFDTLKELKDDIKAKLADRKEKEAKMQLKIAADKVVCEEAKVEIPTGMIDIEVDMMIENENNQYKAYGVSLEQFLGYMGKTMEQYKAEKRVEAEANVKSRVILEAIFNDAKLEVTDEIVNDAIEEVAEKYGISVDEVKSNEAYVSNLKETLKPEAAIRFVVDNAKLEAAKAAKKEEKAEDGEAKKTTAKKTTKKAE